MHIEYGMCFIAEENFVQASIQCIYDVVIGQLGSVVVWAELYMDIGVDLGIDLDCNPNWRVVMANYVCMQV